MPLLSKTTEQLLQPADLDVNALADTLHGISEYSIDYSDIYLQGRYSESWVLEDSIIKSGSYSFDQGLGIRAIYGEKTGFAYADEISINALKEAASAARAIAKAGQSKILPLETSTQNIPQLYQANNPLDSIPTQDKIGLLQQVDELARSLDHRVKQVIASLNGSYGMVIIAASDGTLAADIRPLVHMSITVIAEENNKRETGRSGGGGRLGYEFFLDEQKALNYTKEAVRLALLQLEAKPAPAGAMPVLLGPGWTGILLHEAIGHGLEGDFNRKGTSAFTNRVGQKVASEQCTVVDDGTLPDRRGSLTIDDEGTPTQKTVLIENGILQGYIQDKLNARLMNMPVTGNGRRQSYAHLPMPRMTNTYMLNGKYAPEELLSTIDKGLYAVNFKGGQVDITSGKFVFSASEAYLIENGKITSPVKGATLIGNGPDVLTKVSMVANDFSLDTGVGTCGKEGQSVPVGVGQPSIKIDELTVGGTQA